MSTPIIDEIEKSQMKTDLPVINVGDRVRVEAIITEGKKQRIQPFEGTVIEKKHANSRESITLRKVVDGIGVEKTFSIHALNVANIKIIKAGKVRRAKLYYLRKRKGEKATAVKAKKEV
ncbi:MAG: 50S ribosomal protein L19 [Candidatus Margulisiibacteriota bacterium]|jgi:large subunit ribosomal protein L19